jgi:small subunit ribosomal protein S6
MRHYELVFAVKPTLTEEEQKAVLEGVKSFITSNGGEIYNEENWGRKELAYPIQKFKSANYYLINYQTENSELPVKLEYNLRINERIIRFLNFKIKPKKQAEQVETSAA